MKFPGNMVGPTFCDGDLVQFTFKNAKITLKLPVLPNYSDVTNQLCQQNDFSDGDTSSWDSGENGKSIELVNQSWKLEDTQRNALIAGADLLVYLAEHTEKYLAKHSGMDYQAFSNELLEQTKSAGFSDDNKPADENAPCAENNYLAKHIAKGGHHWLLLHLYFSPGLPASPTLHIPLNERFFLEVSFSLNALRSHYSDNPYTDEQFGQVKTELFEQFIDLIQIDYTPS